MTPRDSSEGRHRLRLVRAAAPAIDSLEARRAIAELYITTVDKGAAPLEPLERTWVAAGIPKPTRDALLAAVRREIRWDVIKEWQVAALANSLTLGELEALWAFVETSEGAAAFAKLRTLTVDVAPAITGELQRALMKALGDVGRNREDSTCREDEEGARSD